MRRVANRKTNYQGYSDVFNQAEERQRQENQIFQAWNHTSLKADYKYSNGYFGDKGQGRDFVRNIKNDDPVKTAKEFYDQAAHGGIEKKWIMGKMSIQK